MNVTRNHPFVVLVVERLSPEAARGVISVATKKELYFETEANARQVFAETNLKEWAEQQRSTREPGETLISAAKVLYRFDQHGNEEEIDRQELRGPEARDG